MWQTLIAKFAHPHLVDRLIWPTPLGTRFTNAKSMLLFARMFIRVERFWKPLNHSNSLWRFKRKPAGAVRVGQLGKVGNALSSPLRPRGVSFPSFGLRYDAASLLTLTLAEKESQ